MYLTKIPTTVKNRKIGSGDCSVVSLSWRGDRVPWPGRVRARWTVSWSARPPASWIHTRSDTQECQPTAGLTHGLKVLTNEKRGGLKVVAFDRSDFKLFTLRFSNKSFKPHPLRGLKQHSETCFYHLKSMFPNNDIVSEAYKNPRNLHPTWPIQSSQLILCWHSKYP